MPQTLVPVPSPWSRPLTSLDAQETKSPGREPKQPRAVTAEELSSDQAFRHSGWRPLRDRVKQIFRTLHVENSRRVLFECCGDRAWVLRSSSGEESFKLATNRCRDRFCLPCQRERSQVVAGNLIGKLKKANCRFITLTLKDSPSNLTDSLTRLYWCWARLRRTKHWKQTQQGGAACLEIKYSTNRQGWHPHLHIVSEGSFLHQAELSKLWLSITGDSFVVDIRVIRDATKAARYITKYMAKGVSRSALADPQRAEEAITAMKGRRLLTTYGTWRTLRLTDCKSGEDWECIGSLQDFRERYARGEPFAVRVLNELSRKAWYGPWRTHNDRDGPCS